MAESTQDTAASTEPDLKPVAYVSMDANPDLEAVFLKIIKPVVESHGLICKRFESSGVARIITPQTLEYIDEADLVVCDLTHNSPRIYYELGIAHAFRKTTILISQETAEIPFDTRFQRAFAYKDDRFGLLELRDALSAVLDTMYSGGVASHTPKPIPWELISTDQGELESARIALFHTTPDARRYALRVLGDCRDSASFDKVLYLISKGTEPPDVVREGLTALHKINPEKALEYLHGRFGLWHADFSVRERVVLLLGNYATTPELVNRLIDQIGDTSWGVRLAVCQTLAKWCAKDAIGHLRERRSVDPEQVVRLAADEALRSILRAAEGQVDRDNVSS